MDAVYKENIASAVKVRIEQNLEPEAYVPAIFMAQTLGTVRNDAVQHFDPCKIRQICIQCVAYREIRATNTHLPLLLMSAVQQLHHGAAVLCCML
jgi:hypothetical protein